MSCYRAIYEIERALVDTLKNDAKRVKAASKAQAKNSLNLIKMQEGAYW
ncbi:MULTISPECIES: hypothetical protein [unclassified Bartonella]